MFPVREERDKNAFSGTKKLGLNIAFVPSLCSLSLIPNEHIEKMMSSSSLYDVKFIILNFLFFSAYRSTVLPDLVALASTAKLEVELSLR